MCNCPITYGAYSLARLVLNPLHLPLWPQPLVPVVRQEAGTLACPGLGNFQDPNNCAR